jgi:DNA-binding response OmpR family regulator
MAAQGKMESLPQILLIEDNFDHIELLAHQLSYYWVNLRVAQSGEEGWAILQQEKIDLLILDYSLPDDDGLTFLKKLRLQAWSRPVVMMTTHTERWLTEEICRQGANYFVQKTTANGFIKKVGEIAARELRLTPRRRSPPLFNLPEIAAVLHNTLN